MVDEVMYVIEVFTFRSPRFSLEKERKFTRCLFLIGTLEGELKTYDGVRFCMSFDIGINLSLKVFFYDDIDTFPFNRKVWSMDDNFCFHMSKIRD